MNTFTPNLADLLPHQLSIDPVNTATPNLADLPPVLASSGQEWQFHIATVKAHIGRSSGRSTPQYWHLVVKNGNFSTVRVHIG